MGQASAGKQKWQSLVSDIASVARWQAADERYDAHRDRFWGNQVEDG